MKVGEIMDKNFGNNTMSNQGSHWINNLKGLEKYLVVASITQLRELCLRLNFYSFNVTIGVTTNPMGLVQVSEDACNNNPKMVI
jgi:hypothetical protein